MQCQKFIGYKKLEKFSNNFHQTSFLKHRDFVYSYSGKAIKRIHAQFSDLEKQPLIFVVPFSFVKEG